MDENNTTPSNGFESGGTGNSVKSSKILIPYIVVIAASAFNIIAYFIPYIRIYNYYGKMSIMEVVIAVLKDPNRNLMDVNDKVYLIVLIVTFGLSILALLFAVKRKMVPTIVFEALSVFLLFIIFTRRAYIHYIGLALIIGAAIWYMVINNAVKKERIRELGYRYKEESEE